MKQLNGDLQQLEIVKRVINLMQLRFKISVDIVDAIYLVQCKSISEASVLRACVLYTRFFLILGRGEA